MRQLHLRGGNFYNAQITVANAQQGVAYEHEPAFIFDALHSVENVIAGNSARTGSGVPATLRNNGADLSWVPATHAVTQAVAGATATSSNVASNATSAFANASGDASAQVAVGRGRL